MEILQVLLKDGDYLCFDDIIVKIKELPNPEQEMIKEVIMLCKVILVNLATSERSFSTAWRLKTWLCSRMNQEQFSNLTVLNIHKERTDIATDNLPLTMQTILPTTTQTESVILALLKYMMYIKFNIIHFVSICQRALNRQKKRRDLVITASHLLMAGSHTFPTFGNL